MDVFLLPLCRLLIRERLRHAAPPRHMSVLDPFRCSVVFFVSHEPQLCTWHLPFSGLHACFSHCPTVVENPSTLAGPCSLISLARPGAASNRGAGAVRLLVPSFVRSVVCALCGLSNLHPCGTKHCVILVSYESLPWLLTLDPRGPVQPVSCEDGGDYISRRP